MQPQYQIKLSICFFLIGSLFLMEFTFRFIEIIVCIQIKNNWNEKENQSAYFIFVITKLPLYLPSDNVFYCMSTAEGYKI